MQWDVAIVGAGMGGAAFGYSLAKAGHRVLFIEKGLRSSCNDERNGGDQADPLVRLAAGRWPEQIIGRVDGKEAAFFPPLGCGAGGSTLLYAGTLERLSRQDFPGLEHSGKPSWPFTYDDIEPFYRLAEQLFEVGGTPDPFYSGPAAPLDDPGHLTASDHDLFELLQSNRVQPYRSHNAAERAWEPFSSCGGPTSSRPRRLNARHVLLEPALATGMASMIDRCTVERIDADALGVRRLLCRREGQEVVIHARHYALAAGALSTPVLMLRSANGSWPTGIGNSSNMVGRNLMFHVSDFMAVWPRARRKGVKARRAIAIRDFYSHDETDFGVIQSAGLAATANNIVHVMKLMIDTGPLRWLRPARPLLHMAALVGGWMLGHATIFATVMQDYPYPHNRVRLHPNHPDRIYFEYCIKPELRRRVKQFRKLYRKAFRRRLMMVLTPDVNLNFGHACGTCRAGSDPRSSVVDAYSRSHDLKNLLVVDASVFPTSGGVNPSLTIAANALRVGAALADQLNAVQLEAQPTY